MNQSKQSLYQEIDIVSLLRSVRLFQMTCKHLLTHREIERLTDLSKVHKLDIPKVPEPVNRGGTVPIHVMDSNLSDKTDIEISIQNLQSAPDTRQ